MVVGLSKDIFCFLATRCVVALTVFPANQKRQLWGRAWLAFVPHRVQTAGLGGARLEVDAKHLVLDLPAEAAPVYGADTHDPIPQRHQTLYCCLEGGRFWQLQSPQNEFRARPLSKTEIKALRTKLLCDVFFQNWHQPNTSLTLPNAIELHQRSSSYKGLPQPLPVT